MNKKSKVLFIGFLLIPLFSACNGISSNSSVYSSEDSVILETSTMAEETTSSSDEIVTSSTEKEDFPDSFAIFSINDTHGSILEDGDSSSYIPGMENLDYCIKQDEDYDSRYSVLLSAGDMSQGSGLSNLSKGQCMMECMNAMGIDAMTLGNHEFDWGVDTIAQEAETAEFPFLGINILNKDDGNIIDVSQPSTIIEKGGLKIGVVGSIYSRISSSISASQIEDIEFVDDQPLVTAEAERLKNDEDCDVVVVLTHQAFSTNAVSSYMLDSNIDGIFGGHDHQFVSEVSDDGKRYFLEGGSNSKGYTKLVFTKNEDGTYSPISGTVEKLTQDDCVGAESLEIRTVIENYETLYGDKLNSVVGERDGALGKYNLGTLVTEAMMYYAEEVCDVDDIALAVHNRGGIRSVWTSTTKNENGLYDITYDDVYTVMPFDNKVQYIELTGEKVIEACQDGYNFHSKDFEVKYNNYYLNGIEIDESETYKVLCIDYMITNKYSVCYQGGDEGTSIGGKDVYTRDLMEDYIKYLGIVHVEDFPSLV